MNAALAKNILLTGKPGCGKTTVVRCVVDALGELRLAGFYTEEVREHARRVGFEIIGLGGQRGLLAHFDWNTRSRVGRYGVEPSRLEPILATELEQSPDEVDLFIIDEIGKMECLSPVFVETVRRVLNDPVLVLATIAMKGTGFIAEAKSRPDVRRIVVDPVNRDSLPDQLARDLQKKGKSRQRRERG